MNEEEMQARVTEFGEKINELISVVPLEGDITQIIIDHVAYLMHCLQGILDSLPTDTSNELAGKCIKRLLTYVMEKKEDGK